MYNHIEEQTNPGSNGKGKNQFSKPGVRYPDEKQTHICTHVASTIQTLLLDSSVDFPLLFLGCFSYGSSSLKTPGIHFSRCEFRSFLVVGIITRDIPCSILEWMDHRLCTTRVQTGARRNLWKPISALHVLRSELAIHHPVWRTTVSSTATH